MERNIAMEEQLAALFPVRISRIDGRGRCVFAARDVVEGEVVLRCAAVACMPLGSRCWTCLAKASAGLLRCKRCGTVAYCSRDCQVADWRSGHREECRPHALDKSTDAELLPSALLLARALRFTRGEVPASARPPTAVTGPCYFHSRADVLGMVTAGHETDESAASVVRLCDERRLVPEETAVSALEARALAAAFPANNFSVTDDLLVATAAAVSPAGALLNHSCAPTTCVTYRLLRLPPQPEPGRYCFGGVIVLQEFRALRAVAQGDELCHSYVETALPVAERRRALDFGYAFFCTCALCCAESVDGSSDWAAATFLYDTPSDCSAGVSAARLEAAALLARANDNAINQGEPETMAFVFPCALPRQADAESSALAAELWREQVLVERSLALLLGPGHIPAIHVRSQEAVREALNRALALGDMGCALAAGLHSVEFFKIAYRATPRHPMLALQLYALGDVCARAAAEARDGSPDSRRAEALGALFSGGHAGKASPLKTLACVLRHGDGVEAIVAGLLRLAAEAYEQARASLRVTHGRRAPLVLALDDLLRGLLPVRPVGLAGGAPLIEAASWVACRACHPSSL